MGIVERLLVNSAPRSLQKLFPGYFGATTKHNIYRDFGYPEHVTFGLLYEMYRRNALANAGIDKTVAKTWETAPWLLEREDAHEETRVERDIRQRFDRLRLWQRLLEADRRSLVGTYAGVILRLADSQPFQAPVTTVPGGLEGLVELIPAWEGQLRVATWDTDEFSATYGQPLMWQYVEGQVDETQAGNAPRSFLVHPDRVILWSEDGTLDGHSMLEPGYNELMALEKISGAGGEGFWKNAKSAPILQTDPEIDLNTIALAAGTTVEKLREQMDQHIGDWQKGFDQLLMLQGMEAKTLGVSLPSPEHFWAGPLQAFAASIGIPLKVLVGTQTGERASTEDAREWAQTNMSRREMTVIPNIMELVRRLVQFSILPERDWHLDWADLTEPTQSEKTTRADQLAAINVKLRDTGELVFTPEEIRAAAGYEPLDDADRFGLTEDPIDAIVPPIEEARAA